MKTLTKLLICVLILVGAARAQAQKDSLFPAPDEVSSEKASLNSAVAQFESIIESSKAGDMETLKSNDKYNQQRIDELQKHLAAKNEYLASIPDVISRQFEALMKQYADADQQTKNKLADDLHSRWKGKESQIRREIAELEEQLGVATGRISESAVKRRMLEISDSLANGEKALRQKAQAEEEDPQIPSSAYTSMMDLSRRRVLTRIRGFCPITVIPLDTELSIRYLDK